MATPIPDNAACFAAHELLEATGGRLVTEGAAPDFIRTRPTVMPPRIRKSRP